MPVHWTSSITGYSNSRSRLAEDRGQQVSWELENVFPIALDMMQDFFFNFFFLPVWGIETKERATFLVLFLAILERKKSNHGPWLVIFSWKEHKPELPASLIKLRIYREPFIYIHLKCSLPGNWLWTEIIIWKDLTLRTVHSLLNAASVLHPFHSILAWCVHHHVDSNRFYMYLLVGL